SGRSPCSGGISPHRRGESTVPPSPSGGGSAPQRAGCGGFLVSLPRLPPPPPAPGGYARRPHPPPPTVPATTPNKEEHKFHPVNSRSFPNPSGCPPGVAASLMLKRRPPAPQVPTTIGNASSGERHQYSGWCRFGCASSPSGCARLGGHTRRP